MTQVIDIEGQFDLLNLIFKPNLFSLWITITYFMHADG